MLQQTLFVIGGRNTSTIEWINIDNLFHNKKFNVMETKLNSSVSSAGVIHDYNEEYIYILGGRPNSETIYRINAFEKYVEMLNITIPNNGIAATAAIYINDRIYCFRGDDKGTTFMYTTYKNQNHKHGKNRGIYKLF